MASTRARYTQDVCEVRAQVPEWTLADVAGPTNPHCHTEKRTTQLKMLGSYSIPQD